MSCVSEKVEVEEHRDEEQTPSVSATTSEGTSKALKLDVSTRPPESCIGPLTSSPLPSPSTSSSSSAMSPPLAQGNSADPVHDLPPNMLAQGWRKFWSKRENRPYYFNKITNESLWEPPHLIPRTPASDPLGISSPEGSTPSFPWPPRPALGEKRPLEDVTCPSAKKPFVLIGPWSLETPTNCVVYERLPSLLHHPHPEVEFLRSQLMVKLRQQYVEMCRSRENIEPPKESFNRWLMERKLIDKGSDPLFPSNCLPDMSKSLYNEIMSDIPIKLFRPKFSAEARKQLSRYAETAKKMIESRTASPETRKIVLWNVHDTVEWVRQTLNASLDDYQERLKHLRQQCQPHLTEAAKSSVEGICAKLYSNSCEDAKKVSSKIQEILKESGLHEFTAPPRLSQPPKKVYCYPVHLIQPCPKLPVVQFCQDKEFTFLRYKNDSVRLRTVYLQKLDYLYRMSCSDDRKLEYFLPRVWCLLKRYQSFMGTGPGEGHSAQVSLPYPAFDCLKRNFDVTFECFASPLNCFFRQYCSAFPDTDGYFGSRGSFFNFHPTSGSFAVHPPFQEDLMETTVDHIERCLHNSSDALSFIVFLPDWKDPVSRAVSKIQGSRFKRESFTLAAFEHDLKNGFQHVCDSKDLNIKSSHPTLVVMVQNDAGFLRWGPTPDRVEALIDSFKPGKEVAKEKELSILSPPPTPQNAPAVPSSNANLFSNNHVNHNNHTGTVNNSSHLNSGLHDTDSPSTSISTNPSSSTSVNSLS